MATSVNPAVAGCATAAPMTSAVLAIHRAPLHEVLRGALPERCVRTGAGVVGATDHQHGATVAYIATDGRHELTADLVVAADGLNSASRQRLWPDHPAPVLDFEELAADCAADGVYEFLLSAPPIKFRRALGSPINPLAVK
ncbi:hypothetical protein [Pseudonocardia alaniniphila]|uniref:FAD binding domain-containing protein n=1 Tax=Pseudonocardia alaniniphila TaxID=75291 RepID=A0ABS9TP62_9PSEU|nr:hypothetical protein [Pseudonocardia alaniniphila]MCH6170343.1 hypothetical protein [Pseudonocardia alaniniphila]